MGAPVRMTRRASERDRIVESTDVHGQWNVTLRATTVKSAQCSSAAVRQCYSSSVRQCGSGAAVPWFLKTS